MTCCGGKVQMLEEHRAMQTPIASLPSGTVIEIWTSPPPVTSEAILVHCPDTFAQLCIGDCNQHEPWTDPHEIVDVSPTSPEFIAWCRDPEGLLLDSTKLDAIYKFQEAKPALPVPIFSPGPGKLWSGGANVGVTCPWIGADLRVNGILYTPAPGDIARAEPLVTPSSPTLSARCEDTSGHYSDSPIATAIYTF